MTDDLNTAPADAGSEPVATTPNPINVDNVDHEAEAQAAEEAKKAKEPKEPEKKPSLRDSLEKAAKQVDEDEKAETGKDKAKPVESKAQDRDETGKFKGKEPPADKPGIEQQPDKDKTGDETGAEAAQKPQEQRRPADPDKPRQAHDDAPTRFSAEAKAEWGNASEHVRAETHRAIRELESGIQEHQKRWEPIKPYDDLAKQHGTNVHEALERYVAFDMDLNQDLVGGLDRIVRDKTGGQYGLRDVIAHVAGQKPDEAQSKSEATIHELRQEIAGLKKQIGGVTTTIQSQQQRGVEEQITAFAADKPNFDRLAPQIAEHIRGGLGLEEAYTKAETEARELAQSLGFIPKPADPVPQTPAPSAQTDKGTKSIAGAPSAGSEPAAKKPSSSVKDAVRRAMAAAG